MKKRAHEMYKAQVREIVATVMGMVGADLNVALDVASSIIATVAGNPQFHDRLNPKWRADLAQLRGAIPRPDDEGERLEDMMARIEAQSEFEVQASKGRKPH